MTGRTHAILGACAAVPVAMLAGGHLALPLCAVAGAVGGLLPDIDHPGSTLGRWVPWPSVAVENHRTGFVAHGRRWGGGRTVWHRGETHSLGAAGIAAGLTVAAAWWPWLALLRWAAHHGVPPIRTTLWLAAGGMATVTALAALVGYLSHVAADMLNVSPQMLLWPFSRKMIHPRHWKGVREGSPAGRWAEHAATLAAILSAVALWGARPV